jgi:hypothetical protein
MPDPEIKRKIPSVDPSGLRGETIPRPPLIQPPRDFEKNIEEMRQDPFFRQPRPSGIRRFFRRFSRRD